MPRRRKKKTGRRNKRRVRRKRRSNPTTTIIRAPSGFPDKLLVKLKYPFEWNPALSFEEEYVFRGNGAQDPEFTGVGAQPIGYDEWSSFYDSYRVFASKIKIMASNETPNTDVTFSVYPHVSSTGDTTNAVWANAYVRQKTVTNERPTTIVSYMKTSKIKGRPDLIVTVEDSFGASTSGVPAQQWYWHVQFEANSSVNMVKVYARIIITYYIQFDARKFLSIS